MEDTTLCFDFGNTRLKCAVFTNAEIGEVIVLPDDNAGTIEDIVEKYLPSKTILASVIDHNIAVEQILGSRTTFTKVSSSTRLPFTTPVNRPDTIGADRIALASAAVWFYGGKNNLVIGMGSCITYNFINKYNQFLGGSISPGMTMRFTALKTFTAKLPLVQPDWNFPLVGYDTKSNILSGVLLGICTELEGITEAYAKRYGNFNVLLTGGDAPYFVDHLKYKIFADPELIFKGLYAISEYNNDART